MSIDRYHGTRTGDYPVEPVNHEEAPQAPQEYADAPQDQGETYQIPEPRDDTQELVNRTAERIREGDIPEKQSRIKRVVALGAAGATLVAGVIGGVTYAKDKMDATPADTAEPTVSAPIVPGPSETATSTPEKLTPETVEFMVNGEKIVGVEGYEGVIARLSVRKANPKYPQEILTERDTEVILTDFFSAVRNVVNMKVTPGGEEFKRQATDAILFDEGTSGELESWVKRLQNDGAEIIGFNDVGMQGLPGAKVKPSEMFQGKAIFTTRMPDGTEQTWWVSTAISSKRGLYHSADVGMVKDQTKK